MSRASIAHNILRRTVNFISTHGIRKHRNIRQRGRKEIREGEINWKGNEKKRVEKKRRKRNEMIRRRAERRDFLTTICHLAIVNVRVIIILSIGNTQITILLLYFLYLFVELMITMNEYILFKPTGVRHTWSDSEGEDLGSCNERLAYSTCTGPSYLSSCLWQTDRQITYY